MRIPNSMMKNILGGTFSRSSSAAYTRIILLSGSSELTSGERAALNTEVSGYYLYNWSSSVYEFTKTRQLAASLTTGNCIRAMGTGQFSLSLSETKFGSSGQAGIDIGLMLLFIGPSDGAFTNALVLSVGLVGSGADVEMTSTISSVNMVPSFGDLILNFV